MHQVGILKQMRTTLNIDEHIIKELTCGHIKNRKEILSLLEALPQAQIASHHEILHFIEKQQFMGTGLGLIDCHFLAFAVLSKFSLWTLDKTLQQLAVKLNLHSA